MVSITLTDQILYNSIVSWGIPEKRKTYNLDSCKTLFEKLKHAKCERDFIRGFLDGDGCIYVDANTSNYISFTAYSKDFLESINNCIVNNTIISNGSFINVVNSWRLSFFGKERITKILEWIYNPLPKLLLRRKFEKWEQLKAKYNI